MLRVENGSGHQRPEAKKFSNRPLDLPISLQMNSPQSRIEKRALWRARGLLRVVLHSVGSVKAILGFVFQTPQLHPTEPAVQNFVA